MTAVLAVWLLGETLGPVQILSGAQIASAALVIARADAPVWSAEVRRDGGV